MADCLPYGGDLLGNVDAHRAPGNASSAADAARGPELVDPGSQLVRHPLPIAGLARGADAASMNVGKAQSEAGVPTAPTLRAISGHVTHVFHRAAEARGANHGAVGAAQAPISDLVPARMIEIPVEQILHAGGVNAARLMGSSVHRRLGCLQVSTTNWWRPASSNSVNA